MGWSATAGAVDNWVYEDTNATFIQDEAMRQRLMNLNSTRSAQDGRRCKMACHWGDE